MEIYFIYFVGHETERGMVYGKLVEKQEVWTFKNGKEIVALFSKDIVSRITDYHGNEIESKVRHLDGAILCDECNGILTVYDKEKREQYENEKICDCVQ